jgi:hypothetical protein
MRAPAGPLLIFSSCLAGAALAFGSACSGLKTDEASVTPGADAGPDAENDAAAAPETGWTVVQERADAGALNAIWGSGPDDIHAVGDDGMIFDYDGTRWNEVVGTTGAKLGGVWGTGPKDVYAVGVLRANAHGVVFHNDGTGWREQIEVPNGLVSIWGIDGTIWAGGLDGVVYKKTTTKDWYPLITLEVNPYITKTDFAPILYSIYGNASDKVLVAADVDTVYYFRGSSQWVPYYDPVDRTRAYRSVWGPRGASTKLYIGANYFGVWLFEDAPDFLTLHEEKDDPAKAQQYVQAIFGLTSDRVIFVGDSGRIMTYDGGPNGLKIHPSPTKRALYGVWASGPQDAWIVGENALILHGKMPD